MHSEIMLRQLIAAGLMLAIFLVIFVDSNYIVNYFSLQHILNEDSEDLCDGCISGESAREAQAEWDYKSDPNVIVISNWTTKMKKQIWLRDGNESFLECENLAPWMKCWFDHRKEAYNRSDAVFFRAQHVFRDDGPPSYRPAGQKWILYETEPPTKLWGPHLDYNSSVWKDFNISVTYTSDSTVPNNIYTQVCELNQNWEPSGFNYGGNKTKKVAWFVSNCETPSLREKYVGALRKYIHVDVFGACGEEMCPKQTSGYNCMTKALNEEYKFYLSFENSFCQEYYTEKLVRTLQAKIIPIVMGFVDYYKMLPPGTYLDIRNFTSAENLAQFLLKLDKNDELYNTYIEEKSKYKCHPPSDRESFACRLCHYLHTHRHQNDILYDMRRFWGAKERCLTPDNFYRGIVGDDFINSLPNLKYFEYDSNKLQD